MTPMACTEAQSEKICQHLDHLDLLAFQADLEGLFAELSKLGDIYTRIVNDLEYLVRSLAVHSQEST
jgi:hypothetical protein